MYYVKQQVGRQVRKGRQSAKGIGKGWRMKGFGNKGSVWAVPGERVGGWWWKHRFFVDNDHG